MRPINDTQQKIYEFLCERSQCGVPPSVREIGSAVGLRSTSSVQANLDALEEAGYIERDPLLKRSIRVLGQAENVTSVPLLGTVTAGMPILEVLRHSGVEDAIIVVTRYFGGTLLGTGGLVRAYTSAALGALKDANIITYDLFCLMKISVSYSDYQKIQSVLSETYRRFRPALCIQSP